MTQPSKKKPPLQVDRARSSTDLRATAGEDWGEIHLNAVERAALLDVLGATCGRVSSEATYHCLRCLHSCIPALDWSARPLLLRRCVYILIGCLWLQDLTFVSEEQLDGLPQLRAVTRGKLKALREEALSGGLGKRKGRRRGCGCF